MDNRNACELIRQTATLALLSADHLLSGWLPDGTRQGREWIARNIVRGDRRPGSFGVNLDTGKWNDLADSGAHGGDLVSLLAYLRGCRQVEAAQEIDRQLGLGLFKGSAASAATTQQIERRQASEQAHREAMQREQQHLEEKQRQAASQAARLWKAGREAEPSNRYLQAKGVKPYNLRQLSGGRLLVPLQADGRLVNLQIIAPDGGKRFLAGGRVKGCYSQIGAISQGERVYLCEGWATGATLRAHTGCAVVCAMNAGNLKPAALSLRARYGDALELVIAGDDDRLTLGNPGRTAANHAANAAGALVIFPEWPAGAPDALSDFNDLSLWHAGRYQQAEAAR